MCRVAARLFRIPKSTFRIPLILHSPLLAAAHHAARTRLLDQRSADGHWIGELSSSPLSTATAISALILAEQETPSGELPLFTPGSDANFAQSIYQGDLSELIVSSVHWLARQQNEDGGWGDTDRSPSNIATTMLVQAAFHLTGVPVKYVDLWERAERYVESQGGVSGLKKRYGKDKTFAVPILTNYALADLVPWRKVPALPFELACVPQRWYRKLRLSVVSYAIPALVAMGIARHDHCPSRNPIVRWVRNMARKRSLAVLESMQPASGGFLEATPLTAFVVMSLASSGLAEHPVVRKGVEFLLSSVRWDGCWPIDTNLAVWNSAQAMTALDWNFEQDATLECGMRNADCGIKETPKSEIETLDWLLRCQHQKQHPYTGSAPGGWAWTDLSGGVPDGDDTSAALLALASWRRVHGNVRKREVETAAQAGLRWLLDLQNCKGLGSDGGWPTFCQGWGRLPFDRSSTDITAHALRALHAWRNLLQLESTEPALHLRIGRATHDGLQYIEQQQREDGSWVPLWFGNQFNADELNPVYGTAKVLVMCGELGLQQTEMAQRGLQWLVGAQHLGGGWGPVRKKVSGTFCAKHPSGRSGKRFLTPFSDEPPCSVEESALAVEALLECRSQEDDAKMALEKGLDWLVSSVLEGRYLEPSPIGFYFAKLWYHERLYPQIFATRTLGRALCQYSGRATDVAKQALEPSA